MPDRADYRLATDRRYEIRELHALQARLLSTCGAPPADTAGRGIVTSVYDRAMASCWVLLNELVRLGVSLPVEAWHGPGELSPANRDLLLGLPLRLTLREVEDGVSGFAIKPVALWRSAFDEVLWIDADNAPLRDPAFLFEDPDYVAKGSLFWRDTTGTERARTWHPGSPVWHLYDVPANDAEEHETGQLLIDKRRCWPELCLTVYYAFNAPFYYRFGLIGEKDTFRLAWQHVSHARGRPVPPQWYHADPSGVPYGMMPYGPFHVGRPNRWGAWGGGTVLVQRDRDGRPLFHHRNTEKFSADGDNHFNADAPNEAHYHRHVAGLAGRRDPGAPPKRPPVPAFTARPEVPCAWGDVFDRLSILELKGRHVTDPAARDHVRRERDALAEVIGDRTAFPPALGPLLDDLAAVNAALWTIEDEIRACEQAGRFDAGFVALARGVYRENDRRAAMKRAISLLLGSALVEEKVFGATEAAAG